MPTFDTVDRGWLMTRLVLVRHGHVDGIKPERFRGRMDLPLTAEGGRQAHATAAYLASHLQPVVVYTSPLRRCVETARKIAAACTCDLAELDELNDLHYGTWQWHTHAEVQAEWPELFGRWLTTPQLVRFPKGEALQDLIARTANVIRMVLERHASETVIVVGHDSGIRALLLQLLDQPISAYRRLAVSPAAVSELEILPHGTKLIRINETRHLGGIHGLEGRLQS